MAETHTANYLDPALLATVGSLELRARMIVEGLMTGQHRSPHQGFSVEFAQHRQYVPGDDTRFLDWKVFGKTDKLYLKQYQKETNLDMVVLVDVSGSMSYASKRGGDKQAAGWRKFDHAATLAAAMAHLALKQQDRVGVTLFDDQLRAATRLSNNQGHWRNIVEALSTVEIKSNDAASSAQRKEQASDPTLADAQTDFAGLFDRVVAKLNQRSLIVLISDLFDDVAVLEQGLARLHHRRHDVIVLQTLDPAELSFPFRSPSDFLGLEAEGRLPLDPSALRDYYLEVLNEQLQAIEQAARKFRFDYLMLDTSKSIGPPLSHFLARRAAAIGKG
ncbi:DUF58 domain-containing protein [Phycisphaerales bacterium AB-hyl4]|uniref:DUF58 domain-containing protein n=1 Tax=Natronomicrosphaera hydrolytica TaxID=3242702 RepID=A0ABV4U862_9BACT